MDGTPRFNVTEQPQVIHRGQQVACHVNINKRTATIRAGLAAATVFTAGVEAGIALATDAASVPLVQVTDWPDLDAR